MLALHMTNLGSVSGIPFLVQNHHGGLAPKQKIKRVNKNTTWPSQGILFKQQLDGFLQ